MKNLFENKSIIKLVEFTLTSIFLYSIFNILKLDTGYFIKTGSSSEYYGLMFDAFIPIITFLFLGIYLITRKITFDKNPQIHEIYKVNKEEKLITITTLVFLMITVCFMMKNFVNSESAFNQFFVKDIITDWKFYIMDVIILSFFILIKKYKVFKILKNFIFTKALFVWFIYLINISGINLTNDYLNHEPISCKEKMYKTMNILIVIENKCLNGVTNIDEINTGTNIFVIAKTINNESLPRKTRAEMLKKFYEINDFYKQKQWVEINHPKIINKSYIFKSMKSIMKYKNIDLEIIEIIIADNQMKMGDYLIKYQSPSLAMQIIKN